MEFSMSFVTLGSNILKAESEVECVFVFMFQFVYWSYSQVQGPGVKMPTKLWISITSIYKKM